MNVEPDPALEEEFIDRLLAGEEALARGNVPPVPSTDVPTELQTRLARGLACVQRLQQLRPKRLDNASHSERELPTRIGRFEIQSLLGRGGFGIVYRAYDPVLCREVALKIPRAGALIDDRCMERFQREARAAAGLDHPNLVPVHEAGLLGPIGYIAYAYCPGNDLATWLRQSPTPIRCVDAARLIAILARAIHYAHGRGVLHRDLKPSNVLLSPTVSSTAPPPDNVWLPRADSALIPRVADFGLAKLAGGDSSATKTGDMLGTPDYMAPEQVDGQLGPVGPATDVYALGAILYEVLTGRVPFWAESALETLLQVKTIEPVRPSRLRPDLPRDLETICSKCLQKEPRKRYASAAGLADDLDRFVTGRPILARPSGRAEQLLKWIGRHPALAASLGAILLVSVAGTAGILIQWQQTQDALAVALVRQQDAQRAQRAEAREHERSEVALNHYRVVLAHHEWQAGNSARSAELLDECRPDLRDWEWRYVHHLGDNAVFTCSEHATHVSSVAYSPDGSQLASATGPWNSREPGEVKMWDAATGAALWTGLGHSGPVMSVAFSPDGRRLASVSRSGESKAAEIKVWDTVTGASIQTLTANNSGYFGVAYSPDGRRLATAGADGQVRIWDANAGRQLFVLKAHKSNVFSVAFSPDGGRLASAGRDGSALLWDLATRRPVQTLRGPIDLRSVAFSPDGQQLVTASFDRSVKIWDVASGQLLRTYWGHAFPVLSASFAPDGKRVVSTDSGGAVHVWHADTARMLRTVLGHTSSVTGAAFNPQGSRLATAGRDRTVRVWDLTRPQDAYSLPKATGAQSVAFSPMGRFLAASGYSNSSGVEKNVRVWLMMDPPRPRRGWAGHTGWVSSVAVSPDETLLASGSADKTVRLWDVATGQTACVLDHQEGMITSVAFNRDGTCLASASLDKTVVLWDVNAGPPVPQTLARPLGQLLSLRFERAVSAQPRSPALVHPSPVHDVAFTPDGKRLVAVGADGMVLVWDVATGTKLCALQGHRDRVERAVFAPDGSCLATAGWDKTIRIWDMTIDRAARQAVKPLHVLAGHTDRIVGLSFSPDGKRLASTGGDQSIRIWDVTSGDEALMLRGHSDSIFSVAFSPNGRLLISAGSRDIKVWDAGEGTPTR